MISCVLAGLAWFEQEGSKCLGPSPGGENMECSHFLERPKVHAVLICSLLQGYYFCVKQYALECSRIPMGQSVNSQVMALQAQLVLLRVGGCFGNDLLGKVDILGVPGSGEVCFLLIESRTAQISSSSHMLPLVCCRVLRLQLALQGVSRLSLSDLGKGFGFAVGGDGSGSRGQEAWGLLQGPGQPSHLLRLAQRSPG